jgi:cytochrome b561
VLAAFILGPGGSELRVYLPARDFERQIHETLGLCGLALMLLRVLWRMLDKPAECRSDVDAAALDTACSEVDGYINSSM